MKNLIYNQDCLSGMDDLVDESITMAILDPPYGIDYQSNFRKEKFDKIKNDKKNEDFILQVFNKVNQKMKKGSHIYCFCSWQNLEKFKISFQEVFEIKNILIWHKGGGFIGDLDCSYGVDYEFILFGYKKWYNGNYNDSKKDYINNYKEIKEILQKDLEKVNLNYKSKDLINLFLEEKIAKNEASAKTILKHKFDFTYKQFELLTEKQYLKMQKLVKWSFNYEELKEKYKKENKRKKLNGKRESGILKFNKDSSINYIHPNQKPISLIEYLIDKSKNEDENIILDPFSGSGVISMACKNKNINSIAYEIDEKYYNYSIDCLK